jgi:hypothetical protein
MQVLKENEKYGTKTVLNPYQSKRYIALLKSIKSKEADFLRKLISTYIKKMPKEARLEVEKLSQQIKLPTKLLTPKK